MPRHPSLFQLDTRVWLNHLLRNAGRRVILADIEPTFDGFAELGSIGIWLLSAWRNGPAGSGRGTSK